MLPAFNNLKLCRWNPGACLSDTGHDDPQLSIFPTLAWSRIGEAVAAPSGRVVAFRSRAMSAVIRPAWGADPRRCEARFVVPKTGVGGATEERRALAVQGDARMRYNRVSVDDRHRRDRSDDVLDTRLEEERR